MFRWTLFLFPFSILYGIITFVRNLFFEIGLFRIYKIPIKSIVVGNLSVGGTGKTPHVFHIANFLEKRFNTVILSRGYGRRSKGYLEVTTTSKANQVGDEPLLLKSRLEKTSVVVSESRKLAVEKIIDSGKTDVIILDDAFQHRKVKAGLSILLTEFNKPFFKDYPLPMGRLREFRMGQNRANIVIVTKCPNDLSESDKISFVKKLNISFQNVYFSKIVYSPFKSFSNKKIDTVKSILLVTAIADDAKIVEYLSQSFSVKTYKFRDHHIFTEEDITKIHLKFDALHREGAIILTTEKDFVKLKEFNSVINSKYPWCFLPIDIEIDRENAFNQLLMNYVETV